MFGRSDLLIKNSRLRNGLLNVLEEFLDRNDTLRNAIDRAGIFEHEAMTEKGPMKMNERSHEGRFWEATDRKAILASHQNMPESKVADFNRTSRSIQNTSSL